MFPTNVLIYIFFIFLYLGQPAHNESTVGGESLKIDLTWTLSDLNNFICQSYPQISLNLTGFELARVGKRRKLQKLQAGSVRELKKSVGKSRLYILPRVEIMQVWILLDSQHCHNIFIHIYNKKS